MQNLKLTKKTYIELRNKLKLTDLDVSKGLGYRTAKGLEFHINNNFPQVKIANDIKEFFKKVSEEKDISLNERGSLKETARLVVSNGTIKRIIEQDTITFEEVELCIKGIEGLNMAALSRQANKYVTWLSYLKNQDKEIPAEDQKTVLKVIKAHYYLENDLSYFDQKPVQEKTEVSNEEIISPETRKEVSDLFDAIEETISGIESSTRKTILTTMFKEVKNTFCDLFIPK